VLPLHGKGHRFESYRNHQHLNKIVSNHQEIKDLINTNHIRIVHLFNKEHPYGGCTIAYQPIRHDGNGYPIGTFARVAVSYCNTKDRYNRKLGQQLALENLLEGEFIKLPIYFQGRPVVALKQIFQDIFTYGQYDW
jgi:hypothetical protein